MGKTNYQTANQRLVLPCIFPEPHDFSHRGSWALGTRMRKILKLSMDKIVTSVQESGTEFHCVDFPGDCINDLTLGVHRRHYIMTGFLLRVIDTGREGFIVVVVHRFVLYE